MSDYAYLLVGVGLGLVALVAVYVIQRRCLATGETKHSWVSYLFIWPLLLDADRKQTRGKGSYRTRMDWLGA
jgi:hypothetical protein